MRSAIWSMSQTSGALAQLVISSAQKLSRFGPRNLSGSSALNRWTVPPFGQTMRRVDGSYDGLHHGGETASKPLGPSTMTRRILSAVGPMAPSWRRRPLSISDLTHSADDLVLWVGIIERPTRNMLFGELTVRHRIGVGSMRSADTIM